MFVLKSRREREAIIVQTMIHIYCQAHHNTKGSLCNECEQLSAYSEKRLLSCMYGERKPVCKVCPVHCYTPKMRGQMRLVMRWAGPKMIFRRPFFAITHIVDNLISSRLKTKANRRK